MILKININEVPFHYIKAVMIFIAHKDDLIQNTIQDKPQNIHSKKYSFNRVQNIHYIKAVMIL